MNKNVLLAAWSGLFVACAGLGFVPAPTGFLKFLCTALSVLFFIPGALLLWLSRRQGDRHTICLIRNLSGLSLGLTLVFLLANVLSVLLPQAAGDFLHVMLAIVSVPMFSSGLWALSLFFWACLLFSSVELLSKMKKKS